MYKAYFDITTVIIYVTFALLGALCIDKFMSAKVVLGKTYTKNSQYRFAWTFFFVFIYVMLAVSRKVAQDIGGSDAIDYVYNFLNVYHGGLDRQGNSEIEPGFQLFTRVVRSFTSDYHLYFLLIYSFIVIVYAKFIREKCPIGMIYIPFILIMYPYLKSFTSIRSSVAISFILLGLTQFDKRKWLSLIIVVMSLLFHRMSVMFVFVWPFVFFFNKYSSGISRKGFFFTSIVGVIVTFLLAQSVQQYFIALNVLSGTDLNYLTRNAGQNYLLRYPMFIGQLFLFIGLLLYYNRIQWDSRSRFLRTLFIYDIWMIPVGLVLGMWRSIEYLYIVRLSLWSVLLYCICKKNNKENVFFVKSIAFLLFVFWLVFRVYKEWDPAKLSPYIFDLF